MSLMIDNAVDFVLNKYLVMFCSLLTPGWEGGKRRAELINANNIVYKWSISKFLYGFVILLIVPSKPL